MGNEKLTRLRVRQQAGENQFGVKLGDIRKLAKEIENNQTLALELWKTGNVDAQLLSILLLNPKKLSVDQLDETVRTVSCEQVADWFSAYIVKKHPQKETLREMWMVTEDPMAARAGWAITEERVVKSRGELDLSLLLTRIESEMGEADPLVQWTMDDEQYPGRNRHLLGRTSRTSPRHRGDLGDLQGLSRFQGVHLPLCPDLDQ
ncbi:MAG: DNA alkylation repair protein [Chloroflexota bacterium]